MAKEVFEALAGRLLASGEAREARTPRTRSPSRATGLSIEVRNGALEQAERAEGVDLGLRVLIGHRQACVSSSDNRDGTPSRPWRNGRWRWRARRRRTRGAGWPRRRSLARAGTTAALNLEDRAAASVARCAQGCRTRRRGGGAGGAGGEQNGRGRRRAGRPAGCTSRRRNGFSAATPAPGTGSRRWRSRARARPWSATTPARAEVHRADLPDPAGDRAGSAGERTAARSGAGKPPTGAWPVVYDERVASGPDRASGAGDQRNGHRPRRELAQGRASANRCCPRARADRGPAPPAYPAARGPSTTRGCRSPAGRWSAEGVLTAGPSISPPPASSG